MADLYVLEGRGFGPHHLPKRMQDAQRHPAPKQRRIRRGSLGRPFRRRVPGIVYGDPMEVLLGRSLWKKTKGIAKSAGKLAVAPITTTYSVTKSAAKATVHAVKNPSLSNVAKIVTNPTKRAVNETKSNVREAGHAALETGRVANTAASRSMNVIRRVAKRLIKGVAKKVLFKGDLLGEGATARVSKGAAKTVLIPVATAAVAANTTTAPAAPIVPVLVNEVIDELYSAIERGIKKGLSPKQAEAEALKEMDKLEPGEENDPKVGTGSFMPIAIGAAVILGLVVVMKKKKS